GGHGPVFGTLQAVHGTRRWPSLAIDGTHTGPWPPTLLRCGISRAEVKVNLKDGCCVQDALCR
ncbi:hypothetical protein, partial [Halopseudomonas laoshanensis]|uniref:hypothetical protein n=1 Tax=Halopseudomonas laoshanensis TaxID=2268758 RepID=UPI001C499103